MATKQQLEALASMSNKYGSDAEYVLAGGGNTSFKDSKTLYVKGSGTALATIRADQFVRMDRASLEKIWDKKYSDVEKEREAQVLADMMDSRVKGETGRPSVETLLHDLFPYKYVLHLHPGKVNGLTCSKKAAEESAKLFPDAVFIKNSKPGYILAALCKGKAAEFEKKHGCFPKVLILQNHGIFFSDDSVEAIDKLAEDVMKKLDKKCGKLPSFKPAEYDKDKVTLLAPYIRMAYGEGKAATAHFASCPAVLDGAYPSNAVTPDHIVYCKAQSLILPADIKPEKIAEKFAEFKKKNGYLPKVVFVKKLGVFTCGATYKEALTALSVLVDALKVRAYAEGFGGFAALPKALADFIVNWEVESYRAKVSLAGAPAKRLDKKIAVVTGAAQGFGAGIAEYMANDGAYVVIADMNAQGAADMAAKLPNATSVAVNVTSEESVKDMLDFVAAEYGGLDIFVNCAGVVKAGSLDEMTERNFDFVTNVNYKGYFLCAKYASKIMKSQRAAAPSYLADIIEINSKSGLAGSNKNFAYAGSKFGGLGLTQSFALELAPYGIKVNAVCPGNFLGGPLWSDPKNGLFVQYLKAGKVPGAKTVADVRRFYEAKVPLGRGCEPVDVVRAIYYIVEQEYETGQAVPVTGGQNMLN